jgi:NADH:ubiquinone oxidoreductase subunit F (NADH-binding)/(2Fe-2S) ferredoxin
MDEEAVEHGAIEVKRELSELIEKNNLKNEVKVVETGPVGVVGKGVVLIIYPERLYYYNVRPSDIKDIVEEHIVKGRIIERIEHDYGEKRAGKIVDYKTVGLTREQTRVVLDRCSIINTLDIEEVIAKGGYSALEKIISEKIKPEDIINEVKHSGLRGRGGAGFPTGLKWDFTRKTPGDEKYLICNADEGEPGTYKDRLILEGDPHKLIEAMIIGGYAVGAKKGYIYIRGEYQLSIERTQKAIDDARKFNLLGNNILESEISFDIEIKKGAGAYVCGEETALIESLEGKRGQPRKKPPYPVNKGLWEKPTAVNNVETLANIPAIIINGANWFKNLGAVNSSGTKVFTILGHVEYPGLVEVEMGTPLKDIINIYGGGVKRGKKFKAALIGGAAGVFLSEKLLNVSMDYESLKENKAVLGSGAILVMDEDTNIPEILFSILKFFAHESCGQCSPCRIGTRHLVDLIYKIKTGEGTEKDLDTMLKIVETMKETSFCPLGQSVIMPVKSALTNFKEDFIKILNKKNNEEVLNA